MSLARALAVLRAPSIARRNWPPKSSGEDGCALGRAKGRGRCRGYARKCRKKGTRGGRRKCSKTNRHEELRPLERVLRKARRKRAEEEARARQTKVEHMQGNVPRTPEGYDSFAARRKRKDAVETMVRGRAFSFCLTLQPNGVRSRKGQLLSEVLPAFIKKLNPTALGKDAIRPWNRHKCIQVVVFYEGAIDDHVHILIYLEYAITPEDLEAAALDVFKDFFPKGTVWVDPLTRKSRRAVIRYCCKEMWRRDRYEQATFFGPNWSDDRLTIPHPRDARFRKLDVFLPRPRAIHVPEFHRGDPASLKCILQEALEEGRWNGAADETLRMDPEELERKLRERILHMGIEELESEALKVIRELRRVADSQAEIWKKVRRVKRARDAKYRQKAGAAQTPHSHRLTPDTCGRAMGRPGSFSFQHNWSCFPHKTLARGPPASGSETRLPGG